MRATADDTFDPLAFERPDPASAARLRWSLAVVVVVYAAVGTALLLVPVRHAKGPVKSEPIFIELPAATPSQRSNVPRASPVPDQAADADLDEDPVPMPIPMPEKSAVTPETKSDAGGVSAELRPSTSAPLETLPGLTAPSTQVLNFSAAAQQQAREDWYARLSAHLDRFKHYPQEARRKGETGTVMLHFAVDRQGRVIVGEIAESSGSARLDAAALDMLRRAAPLPAMPDEMLDLQCDFVIAVDYGLN